MKKQLNPTLVYVLAVIGLLCCCLGGLGLLLSGPAFFIANNKVKDAKLNPDDYDGDIKQMETAKIIALVVLIINLLYLIYVIYQISTIGWDEMYQQFMEAYQNELSKQGG